MTLTDKQVKLLTILRDKEHTEILFGGGAGGAKSFGGCYWLITSALNYEGTRWLMGRSKLKSLKETTLNTFFDCCSLMGIPMRLYNYNGQAGVITFYNGSQIILKDLFLYPSDPNFDSLGSLEITGAFIDECNQITEKAWNTVKSRIRYKVDEYNLIPKILGTCNPAKNWVYKNFYKPHVKGELAKYKIFIQSLVDDNQYISKHYRANLLTLDETSKQRLLYGNWEYDDDPRTLIPYKNIISLFTNDFVDKGEKYITVDVARKGKDSTLIMLWDGFRVEEIQRHPITLVNYTVRIVQEMAHRHRVKTKNIVIDEDGVGGGVVDYTKGLGFVANSRALNGENYNNLKSQCYFMLAKKINDGEIYVNTNNVEYEQLISEELEQVKEDNIDKDGKKSIVPKHIVTEMIGRSPDFSDAMALRMYPELAGTRKMFFT